MKEHRCKCGKAKFLESGYPPVDCQGCSKCNTTYALHPNDHKELIPHDFSIKNYNQDTGEPYYRCIRCHEKQP